MIINSSVKIFTGSLSALMGFGLSLPLSGYSQTGTIPDKKQRPNIIYIMSDDHAWQAISAYGGPCRAVILTGKYSHLNGYTANEESFDGSQQTFPKLLQAAGYRTGIIGKWHLGSDPSGFDHWDILPGQGNYYNPDFINKEGRYPEEGYVTEIITDKSIRWIHAAKKTGKPFMLMMHHKAPHREWYPGPGELSLYKDVSFPEPSTLFDDYSNRGKAVKMQDMTISKTMRMEEDLKKYGSRSGKINSEFNHMDAVQLKNWNNT